MATPNVAPAPQWTSIASKFPFPKFPFPGKVEWLKPFFETPVGFYTTLSKEVLGLTARYLQEQTDYVKKLAECTDPSEALKCHEEFARNVWTRAFNEGPKMLETLMRPISTAAAHE